MMRDLQGQNLNSDSSIPRLSAWEEHQLSSARADRDNWARIIADRVSLNDLVSAWLLAQYRNASAALEELETRVQ